MNFLLTLGTRIRTADPHHYAIVRGMVSVALFVLIGKLMGAAKEMAVAYRYGLSAQVDAYQFVSNLVGWPVSLWCSVLTAVLVPLAGQIRQTDSEGLPHFRAELLGLALLLGIVLAALAWIGIGIMLRHGWSGLPPHTTALAASALPGLMLLVPIGFLAGLQSAWMLSMGRHVNTLLDSIPSLFIGATVLAFASASLAPLVWSTVVGGIFHLIALMVPMLRRREIEAPRFSWSSQQWHWFWQGFGIMLAGQALMSLTTIIDQFFAVGLGTGAIATLGYANRILSLILSLAAVAVSRATLPVFSGPMPQGSTGMHELAMYWMRLMFLAGIGVMAAGFLLAPIAVRLLFERGAFTATDTRIVADVLRYGLPQLPFYCASSVLVSYALSLRRYKLIFWSGVIGIVFKSIANALLIPDFGINGVAAGSIFMAAFIALFFWLTLRRSKCGI